VIAFTDGCPGLQTILMEAGLTKPPVADWFHIAMRLQHAMQTANGLSTDQPRRARAKEVIIAEVDRLKWRIWNGKSKNAQITIERIRNSCITTRANVVVGRLTNCGTRCTRSMRIFEARARGSSITLRDIVPDYALERQLLKAPLTS
jgi:hypothetical protein